MNKKSEKSSKGQFVLGIIGLIAGIVSLVMVITNPNVNGFQEIIKRSWFTIMLILVYMIPMIIKNFSAFTSKSE